jgi:hypothetical protein
LIADKHIKLVYSLGATATMVSQDRTFIYDKILCYGPYHKKVLEENYCNAEIFEVGNVRLDKYFYDPPDSNKLIASLGIDQSKKNIVWLPTAYHNSIREFIDFFKKLKDTYNVIVSPHSLTLEGDMEILRNSRLKYIIDLKNAGDLGLFSIADFVFCDYGGAMFTALYFDKNMVLLNIENTTKLKKVYGEDTAELYFREKYINGYSHAQYEKLAVDLDSLNNTITMDHGLYIHTSARVLRNIIDFKPLINHKCFGDALQWAFFLDKGPVYFDRKITSVYNMAGKGVWSRLSEATQIYKNEILCYELNKLFCYRYDCLYSGSILKKTRLFKLKKKLGVKLGWKIYILSRFLERKWIRFLQYKNSF